MSLNNELDTLYASIKASAPPTVLQTFDNAKTAFIKTFNPSLAIQPGATLPPFTLPSATGETVHSSDLLTSTAAPKGGLLISFYRGGWCPFCNLTLRSLQKHLPQFQDAGVTLVAISPELPDLSLTRKQKMGLDFLVLSDVDNELARKLGIVNPQHESMREGLNGMGAGVGEKGNLEVPVPATLLVDGRGVVRERFVNPDYGRRLEPSVALGWVEKMKREERGEGEKKRPENVERKSEGSGYIFKKGSSGRSEEYVQGQ